MIISRTPVRITFLGGGTDYPNYYLKYGGETLGMAINKYSFISVNKLDKTSDYAYKISYRKNESTNSLEEIEHPSVRACLNFLKIKNIEIKYSGSLPARTGLGSSSSFTVGLLNALYRLKGVKITPKKLAEDAIYIEQQLIGEMVGCQDQYTCSIGGLQNIKYFRDGKVKIEPLDIKSETISSLNSKLMLFYTGIERFSEEILDEQVKNTIDGKINDYLNQTKFLLREMLKKFTLDENLDFVGEFLDQGWNLKKKFSNSITNNMIDNMYSMAKDSGAIGGKLLGAGGGGFMLFYVPIEKQDSVKNVLHSYKYINFEIDPLGSQIIYED